MSYGGCFSHPVVWHFFRKSFPEAGRNQAKEPERKGSKILSSSARGFVPKFGPAGGCRLVCRLGLRRFPTNRGAEKAEIRRLKKAEKPVISCAFKPAAARSTICWELLNPCTKIEIRTCNWCRLVKILVLESKSGPAIGVV